MYKAFKVTLGIFAALAVVFVAVLIIGNVVEWVYRPAQTPTTLAISITDQLRGDNGLTYVKHDGVYHGADYCNVDGYGVPAGEIDYEDGRNWLNDPDCKNPAK